jgi:hypothetical protein
MTLAVPSRTRSSSVGETSLRKCLRVSDRTHSLRMCRIVWRVPQGQLNSSVSSPLEMRRRHAPTKPWPLRYCTILLSILRGASRKDHFKRNCVTLVVHTISVPSGETKPLLDHCHIALATFLPPFSEVKSACLHTVAAISLHRHPPTAPPTGVCLFVCYIIYVIFL